MGVIKDILQRSRDRKQLAKEYEERGRIEEAVNQRKLSHYERELIKSLKAQKEEYVKEALYWEERKRKALDKKNASDMMKFNPEFFDNDSILKEKRSFLRGGNF